MAKIPKHYKFPIYSMFDDMKDDLPFVEARMQDRSCSTRFTDS